MVRGLAKAVRGATSAARKQQQDYEQGSAISREGSFGARAFPHDVKEACWAKADAVPGRDPERWRRDALGNIVFRKLVGCQGCLCHDYDHIVPYSKGGPSTLDNCQILQIVVGKASKFTCMVNGTSPWMMNGYFTLPQGSCQSCEGSSGECVQNGAAAKECLLYIVRSLEWSGNHLVIVINYHDPKGFKVLQEGKWILWSFQPTIMCTTLRTMEEVLDVECSDGR